MNETRRLIENSEIKHLSATDPWKPLISIFFDWSAIVATTIACLWFDNLLFTMIGIVLIGGRMHALGIMMHEAAHYRLLKNKIWNDIIADTLMAWPLLTTTERYRRNHMAHHANANSEKDPDWVAKKDLDRYTFPMKVAIGIMHVLGYLFWVNSIRDAINISNRMAEGDTETFRYKALRMVYYAGIFGIIGLLGAWKTFALYWIIPYFSFFFLFMYFRGVAEHFGEMDYAMTLRSTRTTLAPAWEKLFFSPHNIGYHLEHHLYPSVPYYNLPRLHKRLMENGEYASNAKITEGYTTGLIKEIYAMKWKMAPTEPADSF